MNIRFIKVALFVMQNNIDKIPLICQYRRNSIRDAHLTFLLI